MINIRPLVDDDWITCAQLAKEFHIEAGRAKHFVSFTWISNWQGYIKLGIGHIFVAEKEGEVVGMIGGFICADPNDGEKIATEAFWYVHQEHRTVGMPLLRFWMRYVKAQECKRLTMVHLCDLQSDRLGRIYEHLGLKPCEKHYWMEL